MLITHLRLKNYRCWKRLDMPIGRLTVLLGDNGSGKSAILEALSDLMFWITYCPRTPIESDRSTINYRAYPVRGVAAITFKAQTGEGHGAAIIVGRQRRGHPGIWLHGRYSATRDNWPMKETPRWWWHWDWPHSPPLRLVRDVGFEGKLRPSRIPDGWLYLYQNPEAGLHPGRHFTIADEVIRACKLGGQVVLETHSEYLLTRLQRDVAENYLPAEWLKVYHCILGRDTATATEIVVNRFGEVENWPDDFFGDQIGDLSAMAKAGLAKRRAEIRVEANE